MNQEIKRKETQALDECFTIVISSNNAINRIAGANTTSNYSYLIAWDSIIPEKFRQCKFLTTFAFISSPSAAAIPDTLNVFINFGKSNVYDQAGSQSGYIGSLTPTFFQGTSHYNKCTVSDNPAIVLGSPSTNVITVSIFKNSAYKTLPVTAIGDYTLTLTLHPLVFNMH